MGDSDSDDENVIRYGTPLEPYEEDEIPSKRKYQQAPDQYAVDAHGRRRFHGAFTGGFSAGFGNTVGTAEGWTPATFKSSRSEKASASNQRPEDFMDEEDRDEFGIAPRQMQTQKEFSGQKRKLQQRYHDGPIPAKGEPVLEGLLRPVQETAAMRMLRAMGWKEGQGIGDRVSRKEKTTANNQHKVYGCYLPPDLKQGTENKDSSDSESEYDYKTLFAPDDYEPYILQRKNDRFGLGYSGLSRRSVLGSLTSEYGSDAGPSKSHLYMKDKGKKVSIRGQAFGVGAFEADDDDIYAAEDMSHYDFTLGGATGNKTDRKAVKHTENNVLEGFTKSSQPLPSVPAYPPPALPRDYTPIPAHTKRTRFEPTHHQPRDQGLGRHELSAQARGEILGEETVPKVTIPNENPTPTEPKLTVRNVNFVSADSQTDVASTPDFISIKDTGKDLPKVFKPFASDPKKQARYESYLTDKGRVDDNTAMETDRLSAWERNREMVEFEQAAKLYKPLTGVMFDRFTHASQPDEALNPLHAVAKSSNSYGLASQEMMDAAKQGCYGVMTRKQTVWRPETLVCKRFNIPDPYVARPESAKEDKPKVSYSIFSYLESSVHNKDSFAKEQTKFSGSKSLDVEKTQVNKPKDQIDKRIEENAKKKDTVNLNNDTCLIIDQTAPVFSKRMTVAELFLKESEKDLKSKEKGVEITDTIDKFNKMELYKAIFLSDSEGEEETGENQEQTNKEFNVNDLLDVPKNVERNTSPPRGIFANIDFDELNSWRRQTTNNQETSKDNNKPQNMANETHKEPNKEDNNQPTRVEAENETYGPKIPDNLLKRLAAPESQVNVDEFKPKFKSRTDREKEGKSTDKDEVVELDSSSSDSWVDAEQIKKKKDRKKKSKKHKTKNKKSKHKKNNK